MFEVARRAVAGARTSWLPPLGMRFVEAFLNGKIGC